jgi:hypothetical protein
MREKITNGVKSLDVKQWISIVVFLLTAAVGYGSTVAQIRDVGLAQLRMESSLSMIGGKLGDVISEQARVKQQIEGISRAQAIMGESLDSVEDKLEGVRAEQSRVKQQLEDHIRMTDEHFKNMR